MGGGGGGGGGGWRILSSKVMTFRKDEIGFRGSRSMVNMFITGGFEDVPMIGFEGWSGCIVVKGWKFWLGELDKNGKDKGMDKSLYNDFLD